MFDIGASELLLTIIVAIVVIGPKDLPLALRTAGRWMGKLRRMSSHFRAGLDAMIREAEMEEMEKEWKERNAKIMSADPHPMEPLDIPPAASAEERAQQRPEPPKALEEPQLPLGGPPPPP